MRIEKGGLQETAIKYADLEQMYGVLDIVGKVKWRINKNTLKIVEKIWDMGGGKGTIPLRYYDYKNYVYNFHVNECKDPLDKRHMLKKVQLQRDVHGLRCDFTLK